jgi:hypothetical protein
MPSEDSSTRNADTPSEAPSRTVCAVTSIASACASMVTDVFSPLSR